MRGRGWGGGGGSKYYLVVTTAPCCSVPTHCIHRIYC